MQRRFLPTWHCSFFVIFLSQRTVMFSADLYNGWYPYDLMESMKIAQFSRPSTSCSSTSKISHPLDLGCSVSNEHPPVQTITNELKQNMIEGRNTNNSMLNTINKVSTELFIIIIHWGDVGKTVVMKVLGNYQESVLSNVCFKQLELSNPSTYNYTKNWLNRKCFLCLSREFSKFLGKRSWWNHFIK